MVAHKDNDEAQAKTVANGNGGASAADNIRRAALWVSPIILATSIVVSYAINDRRDLDDIRESHRRDIGDIRDKLDRLTRDITDRLQFIDNNGIRDPVIRLALQQYFQQLIESARLLDKHWANRLRDLNSGIKLPE